MSPINKNSHSLRIWMYRLILSMVMLFVITDIAATQGNDITFQDIAAGDQAGITYRRVESAREAVFDALKQQPVFHITDLAIAPMQSRGVPGIAVFDFDRDGDLDIYVSNGPGADNSLYANQLVETGQVTFVDVATMANVSASDQDSQGVCYGDIDNDGDQDLLVLGNNEPNRLFENQGDGTFANITSSSGVGEGNRTSTSCAMGDVNSDGFLDIVVANSYTDWSYLLPYFGQAFVFDEHNQLFLNLGNNVFADVSNASGIETITSVPPDGEGAGSITWAISLVDYDLDGDVDIIWSDDQELPAGKYGGADHGFIRIFQNDGSGQFTDVTVAANMDHYGSWLGLSFGDVNCDGYLDIFGSNIGDYGYTLLIPYELGDLASRWFLGQPDGTFTDPGVGDLVATPYAWGTSMADYDNDGDPDIIFYGGSEGVLYVEASNPGTILKNDDCSANFTRDLNAPTDHHRRSVQTLAVGDLNRDGFEDIVSAANFTIPEPIPLLPIPVTYGSPFDGDALFVQTFVPGENFGEFIWTGLEFPDGTLSVEISSGDNGNNWVEVTPFGTFGLTAAGQVNRDGIGAVVKFTPNHGHTVMQPILGGSSYASQDALSANFGLGQARRGTVDVLWPGGTHNRLYYVRESERILFPEIPCSFDGDWDNVHAYKSCVSNSLAELVRAHVLTRQQAVRFFTSAIQAYYQR